ncbi:hypothetical protein [Parasynechococcus sp.]|jgi:hypothetical protein|uniref:hypothetical protein n=1 Tax=Parasynechococcus sp. TaxID=3101203 RepID=UPI0037044259
MADDLLKKLRVETLKPQHLTKLDSRVASTELLGLQASLVGDWIAQLEQRFPDLLPSRSPRCLVALDDQQPVSAVIVRPYNRRGSCWSLDRPQPLNASSRFSTASIERALLHQGLQLGSPHICSWVARCPAADGHAVSQLRELGFQPLRPYQLWTPPKTAATDAAKSSLGSALHWEPINRRTARLLWPIEQCGSFSHLRQITDRHWLDLLDRGGPGCGVLMAGDSVLAGLVRTQSSPHQRFLELLRDVAWDDRLNAALPVVLHDVLQSARPDGLITSLDDPPLHAILEQQGWSQGEEQLLMGRNMWRRQSTARPIGLSRPIDEMLGRLRPPQTPVPTPSLGRR